jgi:predicted glycosyltransferase
VVTGPLLPEADRKEIKGLASGLPHLRLVDFDADYAAAVNAADVVVSMGGYNSVVEAVYFGKRPVIVPRVPGPEEQILRAKGFAKLGLATVIKPKKLTADTLWDAIERELSGTTLAIRPLPFDGLARIAGELAALQPG